MFYAAFHAIGWLAPEAKIENETRVAHGVSAKARRRNIVPSNEPLDGVQDGHGLGSLQNESDRNNPIFYAKSYLSRNIPIPIEGAWMDPQSATI